MSELKHMRTIAGGLEVNDDAAELLRYRIDLWNQDRCSVERVLGRVAEVNVAQAIFGAARTEYPDRYVTLHRGVHIIAESSYSDS